jgi:hypothetical protein
MNRMKIVAKVGQRRVPPQGFRRMFPETKTIGLGETAKFPEAEPHGDGGDSGYGRFGRQQAVANVIEAPPAGVSHRALAQELLAREVQGSLRDTELGAEIRE